MRADTIFTIPLWFCLLFFVFSTGGSLLLGLISVSSLLRYLPRRALGDLPQTQRGFELSISLLVPAHNEAHTIADSIRSLLQLSYAEYEIIVINDGSTDKTLEVLIREFALTPFPETYQVSLRTEAIRAVYISQQNPKIHVIDKERGGKADALNAGINLSRNPLFCTLDADSILQRDSLHRIAQPFLDDPSTVAAGGMVRIANGCEVKDGFLVTVGLPRNWLALFQVIEYYRAFWIARWGWTPLNAVLIISGAFGLFRRDTVITVGGYAKELHGEDMELVIRLHRHLRLLAKRYRITFVPDAVCWTEAPENIRSLRSQRIRWQRGLSEALVMNKELLFHRKAGTVGWVALPFMILFEWLSPAVLVFGYLYVGVCYEAGLLSAAVLIAFLIAEIGLGILVSVSVLLMEEIAFHRYPKCTQVLTLFLTAILENCGFRQLVSCWRVIGLWRSLIGAKASWGSITRTAGWLSVKTERL